jgi:hypothetical protein
MVLRYYTGSYRKQVDCKLIRKIRSAISVAKILHLQIIDKILFQSNNTNSNSNQWRLPIVWLDK